MATGKYQVKVQMSEQLRRQSRIEELLLNGESSGVRIAARLGCSHNTVQKDLMQIYDRWQENEGKRLETARTAAIERNENIMRKAMNSHELSKKAVERVSTTHTAVKCGDCDGVGEKDGWPCVACAGKGKQMKEATVRNVEGGPGDPAFLRVAMDAQRECSRLRGLHRRPGEVTSVVNVNVVGEIDWEKVPLEFLLAYRKMHAKGVQLSRAKQLTVDVESQDG